jgi:hypothetical protein
MTPEETYSNIFPVNSEVINGVKSDTLIDDYVLSRNIAKYGLKFKMVKEIVEKFGNNYLQFMHHQYAMPIEEKIIRIKAQKMAWSL